MNHRTLALAGVFQAAELVRQAATHGTWSGYAASAMLRSLLTLEPDSIRGVYGELDRMRLGVEVLKSVLMGEKQYIDSLQYAIGILKVERRFRRARSLQAEVGEELERIANLKPAGEADEAHELEEQQAARIAELYSRTISTLAPRIVVHGRPQYLQAERTVNWIRTLLFAGLRSAYLWEQLGGNRWRLMFGRRQLLHETDELLSS
jgi:high frequency lysogenization protein